MTDAQVQSELNKSKLLYQLCAHLARSKSESDLILVYKKASNVVSNYASDNHSQQLDELLITENIRKRIGFVHGKEDALSFVDIHRKLKSAALLKKRPEILSLLLNLSHLPDCQESNSTLSIEKAIGDISKYTMTSKLSYLDSRPFGLKDASWENNCENNNSTGGRPQTLSYQNSRTAWKETKTPTMLTSTAISSSPEVKVPLSLSAYQHAVSETTLLQDLIYCFQGISGKFLCLDPVTNSFYIDPMVQLSRPRRCVVMQLAELGYLHNRLRSLSDNLKQRAQHFGLMAQALASCISDELTEFYRLLAVLQSQLQVDKSTESPLSDGASRVSTDSQLSTSLTLRQLRAHVADPLERFRWLIAVCEACQEKRGGAIASAIHCFLEHGDPAVRGTVKYLLTSVCKPLYSMLSRWILDGELEDPFNEFFIQTNPHVNSNDQLWHDKYKVRESMVPTFISMAQARKILATGKSINFLRHVCQDHSAVKGREVLSRALSHSSVDAMFPAERDSDLHSLMDNTYLEVSRRVLDVLNTKYKFMEHMQALRRYLLLGQGDFIRHLMDLLEPELRKQASEVYTHNLTAILDSAIRATNAQFEDESILHRLDVRLMEQSPGETGWDIFSLEYNVDGPIGTVFSSCSMSYLTLFNSLWKAKRTEWILSKMWKRLTTSAKTLAKVPELTPLLHQTYLLSSEMIHLVHQLQYYFLFEVMECSWAKLIACVQQADGLDDIIRAHNTFLERIKAGALVDNSSQELSSRLRSVYDCIVRLQILEEEMNARVAREMQRRADYERVVEEEGTNLDVEREHERALAQFSDFLAAARTSLRLLAQNYENFVKVFLLHLASHSDMSLQLLSSRLDFNEHYKRRDSRLTAPLTYQHRRREISETTETFC